MHLFAREKKTIQNRNGETDLLCIIWIVLIGLNWLYFIFACLYLQVVIYAKNWNDFPDNNNYVSN